MKKHKSFLKNTDGGPAAEFALVLPVALIFFFGIIDVGRFMWEMNKAEKATQMGARYAAVTSLVPNTLATTSFVSSTVPQGEPVPSGVFAGTRCINGSCNSAPTAACPGENVAATTDWGYAAAAFTNIVTRMQSFHQDIGAANVVIDYTNVGLGFAGDPNAPDVAPLITVRLCGLTFSPITTLVFNGDISMPDFNYSLTMEDGAGTVSN